MLSEVNLSTTIYENIKTDIVEMRLEPGAYVLERSVAAMFQTSRTPVREAMKRLMQEGWIVGEDRRRMRVSDLTGRVCNEVFEVRMMIERYAVSYVIAAGECRLLAGKLDAEIKKMRGLISDPVALVRADLGFHTVIVEHTGNNLLSRVWESISDNVIRIAIFAMDEQRRPSIIIEEHERIVDCLWHQREDLQESLNEHMGRVIEGIDRSLSKKENHTPNRFPPEANVR